MKKYFFIIIIVLFMITSCKKQTPCEKEGHKFTELSCEEKICYVCGKIESTSKKHEWIEATCTTPKTCKVCKIEIGSVKEHNLTSIELLPTCNEDGNILIKCLDCEYKEEYSIPSLGHVEVVDKGYPATCSKKGLTDGIHCDVCNEVLVPQEEILELDHTFDNMHDDECNLCGFVRDSDYLRVKDEMNLYLGVKLDDLMSLTQDLESIIICPDSLFYIFTVEDKYNVVVEYPAYAEDAAARIEVYYKKEPILEDFESIQKGMTVYEVVEIIGIPFDYNSLSSGLEHYVYYNVDDNTEFVITLIASLKEMNLVHDTKFYEKQ